MPEPIYCPKKPRHWLAERRVTPGGIVLDVSLAAHDGRRGYTLSRTTLDASHFIDTEGDLIASLTQTIGCKCGRWSADLGAAWRGEDINLHAVPLTREEEREFGLKPDRSRHDGE